MDISHRVALVTGAASGIGRASAIALAREGARVVAVDVDADGGAGTAELIRQQGGEAVFFRADVSSPADTVAMVREAEQRFGGLDILHNNAGLLVREGFAERPLAEWQRMMDVNFGGVMLGTHAAIPALQRRGGGAIVNTASIAGLMVYGASPVYGAGKAAIIGFTRSLRPLHAQMNIRANCICPGSVDTAGIRAKRARDAAAGLPPVDRPSMPSEQVAQSVLRCVRDESLAGAVIKVMPSQPDEILSFPDFGIAPRY